MVFMNQVLFSLLAAGVKTKANGGTAKDAIAFLKSNFRKGGESLPGFVANPQVCPTFSEITFEKQSKYAKIETAHPCNRKAGKERKDGISL